MLRIDNNLCIIDKNKIADRDFLDKSTVLYKNCELFEYTDYLGLRSKELYIYFSCETPLEGQLIIQDHPVYLSVSSNEGKLRLPVVSGIMKHYFKDHENYYYLKEEDTAVHSSLAEFIPAALKRKATPSTAYVKKEGVFLPQYEEEITPCFKPNIRSRLSYFEFSEELLSSKERMQHYLTSLLTNI